jgi:cystathionine beta-lyase family protein involved in aluminum resistance
MPSDTTLPFSRIDQIALANTARVSDAFIARRVSEACLQSASGYAYGETGRDTLDKLWADVFFAEDALVRVQFVNGTHALACALRAACPDPNGQGYISLVGEPYDTLRAIAPYRYVPPAPDGSPDHAAIAAALLYHEPAAVFIQRSRGYSERRALSVADIADITSIVRECRGDIPVICDNCYCEFCEDTEPPAADVDMTCGSLIKNPGGGLCVSGGYIAGKTRWIAKAAECLTAPGIGRECGGSMGQARLLYQGLFMAPHITAQALKTAVFAAGLLQEAGYPVSPLPNERRYDIVQAVRFGAPEPLMRFVRAIQAASPIDSFVVPEPWLMPGYGDKVIMAAGTFIQGASIELTCDAPMRQPYIAYLQGGLTYESGSLAIARAVAAALGAP